ncbi:DUF3267 domain-containing protein [Evansella halocellulosilytica]|uniref:DUF3267 domain-containing protein n=1 Tax=Evansella halocellulosilytica TaxID=2011013 RepID=UPI000BB9741B|nr:DUF3267 domain-containing protein [Evansella halocellulosilytica]
MNPEKVNFIGTVLAILLILVLVIPYGFIWGIGMVADFSLLYALFWFVLLIILHEILHLVGYTLIGGAKWSEIKLGVMWKQLMPYAHCKVPLKINHYRIAVLLPIVLGIFPTIIGYLYGNGLIAIIGIFMTTVSIGDLMIIHTLRKFPKRSFVQDHPNKIGCIVYLPQNERRET